MNRDLDIIIPVYNEGENILDILSALRKKVKTSFHILICYDFDEDNTLPVLKNVGEKGCGILFVKNPGRGVHRAVVAGFDAAIAPAVLMFPADEVYNVGIIDAMYEKFRQGNDIVVASRFTKGGVMKGGPLIKSLIVRCASFILQRCVGLPTSDATYGLRLFSKKILDTVAIESTEGFTYSIELLVKCHRLRWGIGEVPAKWFRREKGTSRFHLIRWLPHYTRWFWYAVGTTYLRKSPQTVKLKHE